MHLNNQTTITSIGASTLPCFCSDRHLQGGELSFLPLSPAQWEGSTVPTKKTKKKRAEKKAKRGVPLKTQGPIHGDSTTLVFMDLFTVAPPL